LPELQLQEARLAALGLQEARLPELLSALVFQVQAQLLPVLS
jgi:hypothetical protein